MIEVSCTAIKETTITRYFLLVGSQSSHPQRFVWCTKIVHGVTSHQRVLYIYTRERYLGRGKANDGSHLCQEWKYTRPVPVVNSQNPGAVLRPDRVEDRCKASVEGLCIWHPEIWKTVKGYDGNCDVQWECWSTIKALRNLRAAGQHSPQFIAWW